MAGATARKQITGFVPSFLILLGQLKLWSSPHSATRQRQCSLLRKGADAVRGRTSPALVCTSGLRPLTLCRDGGSSFLVFTGARLSEVLGLKWEWIDFPRGEARLPDSKMAAKILHLPPSALATVRKSKRRSCRKWVSCRHVLTREDSRRVDNSRKSAA